MRIHKYLFSGMAHFELINTKTGQKLTYFFLSTDSYGTKFLLYCTEINGKKTDGLGTIGEFEFAERANERSPVRYRFKLYEGVPESKLKSMEFKAFIFMIEHDEIPEWIRVRAYCCGKCGSMQVTNNGFCQEHRDTKVNLFNWDGFF